MWKSRSRCGERRVQSNQQLSGESCMFALVLGVLGNSFSSEEGVSYATFR